jgi:Na+/melibiose symporter-like transporter
MVRAFKAEFLKSLNLKAMDYEINPEMIYKAFILRARIVEIPAHLDWSFQNKAGAARISGIRIMRGIFSGFMSGFIFRPYFFFFLVGMIMSLIFLYIFVWTVINIFNVLPEIVPESDYFDSKLSEAIAVTFKARPHAFFIGGGVLLIAIQFLSLGFLSLQSKRYFEETFNLNSKILKEIQKKDE